jgi:hypothetical protein
MCRAQCGLIRSGSTVLILAKHSIGDKVTCTGEHPRTVLLQPGIVGDTCWIKVTRKNYSFQKGITGLIIKKEQNFLHETIEAYQACKYPEENFLKNIKSFKYKTEQFDLQSR